MPELHDMVAYNGDMWEVIDVMDYGRTFYLLNGTKTTYAGLLELGPA